MANKMLNQFASQFGDDISKKKKKKNLIKITLKVKLFEVCYCENHSLHGSFQLLYWNCILYTVWYGYCPVSDRKIQQQIVRRLSGSLYPPLTRPTTNAASARTPGTGPSIPPPPPDSKTAPWSSTTTQHTSIPTPTWMNQTFPSMYYCSIVTVHTVCTLKCYYETCSLLLLDMFLLDASFCLILLLHFPFNHSTLLCSAV